MFAPQATRNGREEVAARGILCIVAHYDLCGIARNRNRAFRALRLFVYDLGGGGGYIALLVLSMMLAFTVYRCCGSCSGSELTPPARGYGGSRHQLRLYSHRMSDNTVVRLDTLALRTEDPGQEKRRKLGPELRHLPPNQGKAFTPRTRACVHLRQRARIRAPRTRSGRGHAPHVSGPNHSVSVLMLGG